LLNPLGPPKLRFVLWIVKKNSLHFEKHFSRSVINEDPRVPPKELKKGYASPAL